MDCKTQQSLYISVSLGRITTTFQTFGNYDLVLSLFKMLSFTDNI